MEEFQYITYNHEVGFNILTGERIDKYDWFDYDIIDTLEEMDPVILARIRELLEE